MLEQIAAYLEKLGYTTEEQGTIEKYLIVFQKGKPLGFILSDCSVCLVSDMQESDGIRDAIAFLKKNQSLKAVGNGEFLLGSYRQNQITTFYDVKNRLVRFAVYLLNNETGEVGNTVYESEDTAMYRFITESGMFDVKKYLPKQRSFADRIREKLLHYLLSKSKQQPERQ